MTINSAVQQVQSLVSVFDVAGRLASPLLGLTFVLTTLGIALLICGTAIGFVDA